jgi:hypothetical protein
MKNLTTEQLIEFEYLYDLLVLWKDSDKSQDIKSFYELLEKLGLWAFSNTEETDYLTPFDENRRSFVLKSPNGWKMGDFPIPGEYSLALLKKTGVGSRESEMDYIVYNLQPNSLTLVHKYTAGYLFTFLEEKKRLRLHNYSVVTDKASPYYEKSFKMQKREEEIRQVCIKIIPELTHYTWPDFLEISGEWKEKERSDSEFFKKTFEMLSGDFFQLDSFLDFDFKPIVWKNKLSKLTHRITYTTIDENARRMYGIEEKKEFTEEIGIWLTELDGLISFEVKFKSGKASFMTFSGKLFPNRIELTLPFFLKKPKGKKAIDEYFDKLGLSITNM